MKKTFTLFRVLLTFVLLCGVGNAWGENKTLTFNLASNPDGWPTTNPTTLTNYTYKLDETEYTFALKNVKCNSGYLMLTSTAVLGLPAIEGYQLTKVEAKNSSGCSTSTKVGISSSSSSASYITGGAIQTWSTTGSTYTYNLSGTSDNTVYYLYVTNKNAQITQLSLTFESIASVATPIIDPSNGSFVNSATAKITCATTGASIYYTTDGTNPTNASTAYTDTDPITVTETTTIKAIAYKDGEYSAVATATYTKINPLTSMDAVFNASETPGNYWITFDNWVVSGVNGNNAYLTDNNGKGLIIYKSGHGFVANDVLSGTVNCALTRYNGSAEITNLTASSKNLTVTHNGALNTIEKTIADLSGVNTGAYVDLGTLTYNGSNFTDGQNTVKPYGALNNLPTLINGVKYKVKGMYLQYNNEKEICPLNEDDFEEIPATKYEISIDNLTYGTITASVEEAVAGAEITLTITPNAHYALKEGSLCVLNETTAEEIDVVSNKFKMPASNVLVSAEFEELTKYTVIYSVLGVIAGNEEVYDGETITNAPTPDDLTGWQFAGWTANEDYVMSTTAPVLFTETTPVDDDYILYAVFSKTEGGSDASQYVKVTTAPADWSGKYLFVFEGAEVNNNQVKPNAFDGSLSTLDAASNYVNVSIVDDAIAVDATNEKAYFEISKIDDGYCITSQSGYSIGGTSGSNVLNSNKTSQYLNTIELATEGNAIITSNTSTLQFNAANNQLRYRYYKTGSTQKPVYLYKLEGGTTVFTIYKPQTQDVTISPVGYATAYIPFNATVSNEANDVKAYFVTVEGTTAKLNEIEGTIPANTGMVLKGAGKVTFTESAATPANVEGNLLIGTADKDGAIFAKDNTTYYILSSVGGKVGFYWDASTNNSGATANCAQYKAVLAVPASTAPSFFTFDDATAINVIDNAKVSGVRYNLNGQAVGADYKGIVIVNGKKMFNK